VFLSTSTKECWDRIEAYAGTLPTAVLIESAHSGNDSHEKSAIDVLRALSNDVQGARYMRPVMPFAVLPAGPEYGDTTQYLRAGAVEILESPLRHEDLLRLVGHVKEEIRPPARLVGVNMARNLADSIRNVSVPSEPCHRPDQTISVGRLSFIQDAIGKWHFPAHELNMDELTCAVVFMVEHLLKAPELKEYSIPRTQIMGFLLATRRQYKHEREVHYHNWRHAVDVTQSIYSFLKYIGICPLAEPEKAPAKDKNAIASLLTPLDGLILLISGIGHDVGHPGVNNAFLVACSHPLAQMYNDKSVLENYHCAAYTQLLRRHWPSLGKVDGFRASMISSILATDMQRHFEYMTTLGELKKRVASGDTDTSGWSDKDKTSTKELLMAILIKAADISNVARPFDISAAWAKILMNEFARQGELEAELEIPTCLFGGPPNKEDMLGAAQSQKGFMNLFGFPLFQAISAIIPSVACSVETLEANQATWERKIQAEKDRRNSEGKAAPLTFSSVGQDEIDQAAIMHHRSEPAIPPLGSAQTPSSPVKRGAPSSRDGSTRIDERQRHIEGFSQHDDGYRASAPSLGLNMNSASRRSSKDVALDQLQQLSMFAQQNFNAGSRRGSADAGWQVNQSFPTSRRGSKDESLTTILVKSQASPGRRSPPNNSSRSMRPPSSPSKPASKESKRQSAPQSHKQRNSVPSSRSHATSSATANTEVAHSTSTQPSSLAATDDNDDDHTTPSLHHGSGSGSGEEDPSSMPGYWPSDLDGSHKSAAPVEQLTSIPGKSLGGDADSSPRIISRMASGDSEDTGRLTPRKQNEPSGIRESRSRSRLRGLKFWKKKKEVGEVEGSSPGTSSPP
jgi:3',5'-cyclic-nucleotide phosphodiesterase